MSHTGSSLPFFRKEPRNQPFVAIVNQLEQRPRLNACGRAVIEERLSMRLLPGVRRLALGAQWSQRLPRGPFSRPGPGQVTVS